MTVAEDIEYLKMIHFLPETLQPSDISKDLNQQKIWADTLWRKKNKHQKRVDPELIYLKQNKDQSFKRLLEIGAAYGRLTRQLVELEVAETVTAIDICHYFQEYVDEYVGDDPIRFIFDDFLTTSRLRTHEFDLIVLPMNTVPSFPRVYLNQLFDRVRQVLQPGGKFIFTTYPEETTKVRDGIYDGELLVELGEYPIAVEFYTMKDKIKPWGVQSVTYSKYQYLDNDDQTFYFKTQRNLYHHAYLVDILTENHLTVSAKEDIDHSTVFVCHIENEQ